MMLAFRLTLMLAAFTLVGCRHQNSQPMSEPLASESRGVGDAERNDLVALGASLKTISSSATRADLARFNQQRSDLQALFTFIVKRNYQQPGATEYSVESLVKTVDSLEEVRKAITGVQALRDREGKSLQQFQDADLKPIQVAGINLVQSVFEWKASVTTTTNINFLGDCPNAQANFSFIQPRHLMSFMKGQNITADNFCKEFGPAINLQMRNPEFVSALDISKAIVLVSDDETTRYSYETLTIKVHYLLKDLSGFAGALADAERLLQWTMPNIFLYAGAFENKTSAENSFKFQCDYWRNNFFGELVNRERIVSFDCGTPKYTNLLPEVPLAFGPNTTYMITENASATVRVRKIPVKSAEHISIAGMQYPKNSSLNAWSSWVDVCRGKIRELLADKSKKVVLATCGIPDVRKSVSNGKFESELEFYVEP